MLKNLNIGLRVLLGSALVLILAIGILVPVMLFQLKSLGMHDQERQANDLFRVLSADIADQGARSLALSAAIAQIPEVQEAFANRDRERLQALMLPTFDYLREHHAVRQFQFLTAPATSFLRLHMLDRHGDDLTAIRRTIVESNRSGRPIQGLETGVAGLGIRGVEPVFYRGRQVGVVEFGMAFDQAFFDRFKADHAVEAALQMPAGPNDGFTTFAGTIEGGSLLTPEVLQRVLDGETFFEERTYQSQPTLIFAKAIDDFSGRPVGVVELLIDRSSAVTAYRIALWSLLGIGAAILLFGLLVSWVTARGIAMPIRQTADRLLSIADGDGDLTQRLPAEGRNELASLARAFNRFIDKIHDLVKQVAGASAQLSAAAEQLSMTSGETSHQVMLQQSETDQVAAAVNEMTATVEEVARHAAAAARVAQETDSEAGDGDALAQQTVAVIEQLAHEVEEAGNVVSRLSDDSKEIGAVLDVIRGVAEQTNLLALNAAIEAARAGEQGRGFAVVADEVRTLASRTQASTEDIRTKIERVQSGSMGAVTVMDRSRSRAREGVNQARRASDSFKSISQSIASINDMNTQIASAAEQQSAVAEEINRNIHTISQAVEQTASGSGHIAEASGELARLASELQERVQQFRI